MNSAPPASGFRFPAPTVVSIISIIISIIVSIIISIMISIMTSIVILVSKVKTLIINISTIKSHPYQQK